MSLQTPLVESLETTGALLAFDDVFYNVLRRIVVCTLVTMEWAAYGGQKLRERDPCRRH